MAMDNFLSQVYGTGEMTKEAEAENQATAELYATFEAGVEDMCKEAQYDPAQLTEEEIAELWEGFTEKVAEDFKAEQTFQEKYAGLTKEAWDQADVMGRISAHAYVDEMNKIAASQAERAEASAKKPTGSPFVGKGVEKSIETDISRRAFAEKHPRLGSASAALRGAGKNIAAGWKSGKGGKAALIGAPLAAGAALAGGAYAGKKALEGKKKAAALGITEDEMNGRAYDMLKESGWLFESGEVMPPEEGIRRLNEGAEQAPAATEQEKEAALNQAALEHLAEAGYPINTNEQ